MGFDDAGLPPRDAVLGYVNNKHFRVGFRSFVVFLAPPGSFSALGFNEKKTGYVNNKRFGAKRRKLHIKDRRGPQGSAGDFVNYEHLALTPSLVS